MKTRSIIPRELANRDVEAVVDYYLNEGAEAAALSFVAALDRAYAHIARHPAAGTPRYAHELNLPDLRIWPLARFPYLVFYVERKDHVDVWRVLHQSHDIPARMREPDDP